MLRSLIARRTTGEPLGGVAAALYSCAVDQAREPVFYTAYGVPDSLDGRFDLITLHVHLICRRLRRSGDAGARLAQAVFDAMFRDMDRNLREMGVGDPSIPKRIRAMAQAYLGRAKSYDAALAQDEPALASALARNVLAKTEPSVALPLAAYVRRSTQTLDHSTDSDLFAGRIAFGAPQP